MNINKQTFEFIKNVLRFDNPDIKIYRAQDNYKDITISNFGDRDGIIITAAYIVKESQSLNKGKFIEMFSVRPLQTFEKHFHLQEDELLVMISNSRDLNKVLPDSHFVDEYGGLKFLNP